MGRNKENCIKLVCGKNILWCLINRTVNRDVQFEPLHVYLDIHGASLMANNHVLDVGWNKDVLHCLALRNDKDEAFTFKVICRRVVVVSLLYASIIPSTTEMWQKQE